MLKKRYCLAILSFALGLLLILTNIVGLFMGPVPENEPKERKPVANYDFRTLNLEEAQRQFADLQNKNISAEDKALIYRIKIFQQRIKLRASLSWFLNPLSIPRLFTKSNLGKTGFSGLVESYWVKNI